MKTTIALFLVSLFTTTLYGQSKYCKSYSDYMNDHWITIDTLSFTSRSDGDKMWNGGGDFKPQAGDEKTDKFLKKKARFIIHNDTLYVNCKGLKYQGCVFGNWFTSGFRYGEDKICFVGIKLSKARAMRAAFIGLAGEAIVAAAGANNVFEQYKHKTCYFIDSDKKAVKRMTTKYMENLLSEYPNMLEEFNNMEKKEKGRADVILTYLQRLQLLGKY